MSEITSGIIVTVIGGAILYFVMRPAVVAAAPTPATSPAVTGSTAPPPVKNTSTPPPGALRPLTVAPGAMTGTNTSPHVIGILSGVNPLAIRPL